MFILTGSATSNFSVVFKAIIVGTVNKEKSKLESFGWEEGEG